MANTDAVTLNFTDVAGNVGQMRGRMLSSANDSLVTDALDDIQAASDLKLNSWTRAKEAAYTGTGPTAQGAGHRYADASAKLVMVWGTGNTVVKPKLEIPGPIESLFTENDFAIDNSDAAFNDLKTAFEAAGVARGGTAVTSLLKGHLISKHGKHAIG